MPPKRKYSGINIVQPKYNMFSVIDEGVNNLLIGRSCTCPSNEVIADDHKELIWDIKGRM